MTRWILPPVACLAVVAAVSSASRPAAAVACPSSPANRLTITPDSTQLITVVPARRTSTQAPLRLWTKAGGGCWIPAGGPWRAWLGRNGVSARHREGDGTTPSGTFGFQRTMYGAATNPGVRYAYHRTVCGDWWVEDPRSRFYNRFRHVRCGAEPLFGSGEELSRSPTAYRYLAVVDYNTHPVVPGRGSGIFLHASIGRPTSGCVSLPVGRLVTTLRWLRPAGHPRIAIGTSADLGSSAAFGSVAPS
jgi:L,D-peptidoglycan transpeptidase YkuD (ErfK/YbiS/YcfS/YnhG family)